MNMAGRGLAVQKGKNIAFKVILVPYSQQRMEVDEDLDQNLDLQC